MIVREQILTSNYFRLVLFQLSLFVAKKHWDHQFEIKRSDPNKRQIDTLTI